MYAKAVATGRCAWQRLKQNARDNTWNLSLETQTLHCSSSCWASTALPKLSSTFDHLRMLLTFAANASISSPAACHRGWGGDVFSGNRKLFQRTGWMNFDDSCRLSSVQLPLHACWVFFCRLSVGLTCHKNWTAWCKKGVQFGDGKKISGEAGGAEIEGQLGGLIWAALELSTPIQELVSNKSCECCCLATTVLPQGCSFNVDPVLS